MWYGAWADVYIEENLAFQNFGNDLHCVSWFYDNSLVIECAADSDKYQFQEDVIRVSRVKLGWD